jgi:hypothetical protein
MGGQTFRKSTFPEVCVAVLGPTASQHHPRRPASPCQVSPSNSTLLIASVVDWDDVYPVPLKYSAITLETKIFGYVRSLDYKEFLNPVQEEEFQRALIRIEQERSNSSVLSDSYSESKENFFLDYVLRGYSLCELQERFPVELPEALRRTPDRLGHATREWEEFTRVFFISQGRPVPYWSSYIEIQQGLGIMGKTDYSMIGMRLRWRLQALLVPVLSTIIRLFPQSEWAARNHCYFQAAVWERYRLPNGKYSC